MIQNSLKQACLGKGGNFPPESLVQVATVTTSCEDDFSITCEKEAANIQEAAVTNVIKQDYPLNHNKIQDGRVSPKLINLEVECQAGQGNQQDRFCTPNLSITNESLGNEAASQVSGSSSLSDIQGKLNIDAINRTVSYQQQTSSNNREACRIVKVNESPSSSSESDHSHAASKIDPNVNYVASDAFLNQGGNMEDSLHYPHPQTSDIQAPFGCGEGAVAAPSGTSVYPRLQEAIADQQVSSPLSSSSPHNVITTQVSNSRSTTSSGSGKYEYESNVHMNQLLRMGFCDRPRNARLLAKYNNNVEKVVEDLVEEICSDSWFNNFV